MKISTIDVNYYVIISYSKIAKIDEVTAKKGLETIYIPLE